MKNQRPAANTRPGGDTPQQRLHPLLVRAVASALHEIFVEKRYADKVIEQALRQNPKAGSRDRAFVAETTYEIVRYYRLYTDILGRTPLRDPDFWQLVGIHLSVVSLRAGEKIGLPDWQEFKSLHPRQIAQKWAESQQTRAIAESIPDWVDALGASELEQTWDSTLHWLNRPARVVLRTNGLKTTRSELRQRLRDEGIETEPRGDLDALVLERRQNVFGTAAFKAGLFEVQDYSSQLVAPLLAPAPGMRVVDACAGGGGKTLHLAALMQNKGSLIALDTLSWKLDALRLRARRAGASNIDVRTIESRKTIKRLYGSADRLLLDVPCSGLGVLRRNPDTKWKLQPEQLAQLQVTQQDILQAYAPIVRPGGRVVYATCSILPSENRQQVDTFLQAPAGQGFSLVEDRSVLPQDEGFDGFYMALLERWS
jgi:16S rRNA (cytosine967-C5)-methyltransferase